VETCPFAFEVFVPQNFSPPKNKEVQLFTSLFIREENLALYGFPTLEQKKFFHLALTVPGVGPKLGLSLLSSMPLHELAHQIQSGNTKALEKISGVGKKLAQRLVGDLKGKVAPFVSKGSTHASARKAEVVEFLVNLGLEPQKAWEAVESLPEGKDERSLDEWVELSLKKLGEKKK